MLRRHEQIAASALGQCIDRMLKGSPWEDELPQRSPEREEVVGLMAVAQWLLGMARRTRTLDAGGIHRVWAATERRLNDQEPGRRRWLSAAFIPI
ncbi:MAG: hypothetical protein HY875_08835 [Chloroflexi bacterium]|nr:hypothetical protein [Chloroflexota bacterium]